MLYKISQSEGKAQDLKPVPFTGLELEKRLEDVLARSMLDTLFQGNELLPIKQERVWQPEADIYSLNRQGDLVIFELKRDTANAGAVHQALRYCEKAAFYDFSDLQHHWDTYRTGSHHNEDGVQDLQEAHKEYFELSEPLPKEQFNQKQHLVIVGTAGCDSLIRNIEYWKSSGISIDFMPYRVYRIGEGEDNLFLEFFSKPYDICMNPADRKGVIFDTCRTFIDDSIWYMCENSLVAAFGGNRHLVNSFAPGDVAFIYHKGRGIVAAGEVTGSTKDDDANDASYRQLKWLSSVPSRGADIAALSASEIKRTLGHGFFWAKTMKVPYLSYEESGALVKALVNKVGPPVNSSP